MTKISALSDIGTSVASNDTFVLVDVSDPTTPNKKIQQQNILAAGGLLPDGSAGTPGLRFLSDTNVGLFRPTTDTLAIATGGSERLRIDSSGRLGLGTSAPDDVLDVRSGAAGFSQFVHASGQGGIRIAGTGSGSSANLVFSNNHTAGITDEFTIQMDGATDDLLFISGGTGGTERVRITEEGRVGIGTATPNAKFEITNGHIRLSDQYRIGVGGTGDTPDQTTVKFSSDNLGFFTGNTERARIDSSGRLLVGTSSSLSGYATVNSALQIAKASGVGTDQGFVDLFLYPGANVDRKPILSLTRTRGSSVGQNTAVASGDSLGAIYFNGGDGSTIQTAAWIKGEVDTGTISASSMPGRLVFSTTADGASSPTERMRITQNGDTYLCASSITALFNTSTETGFKFDRRGGLEIARSQDTPLFANRIGNDGDVIAIVQAGVIEGAISVSGTTVTYGGGHLARWSQLPNNEDPSDILKGTVMSNLDEMCEWGEEDNEQLNKTKVSDVEGDSNVAGVFVSTAFSDEGPLDFFVAMTGDMIIRIANGVTVQRGDLLMSAGDGTAKPQDDDIVRSKTVAKVTSTHVTCTYDDGSYCVPCVLMAC